MKGFEEEEKMNRKGIVYLKNKLECVRAKAITRYSYYEGKDSHQMPKIAIPRELSFAYKSVLGWNGKSVDMLADRLNIRSIENDELNMGSIFDYNNPDVLFDSAILGALVTSCDFIYIFKDSEGNVKMQVIDGTDATGIMDTTTNLLTEGYAVLDRDSEGKVLREAYFEPFKTTFYEYYEEPEVYSIESNVEYPLLVPVVYKPSARRPFGQSRISKACIDYQDKAKDVLTRAAVTAEFYSFPQKYVLGLSDEAESMDAFRATISAMLRFDKDEDGDHPVVGQFNQQSMTPHIDHFKMYAACFCGETGLTMDDIGFPQNNPSSSEAIKATHESLRARAKKAQKTFTTCFKNVGFVAACLRDNQTYSRTVMLETRITWEPVIEPDSAMLAAIGDGANKINGAVPGYFQKDNLEELTGIRAAEDE